MAVNLNIPSQVKPYANLAAFPATGAVKTIYIAEDTNKTYRWTGSAYVEISASAASGLTIGTTPITSGTIGRVLFQGTGDVLQQSSSLFWDNTNGALELATTSDNIFGLRLRSTTGQLKVKPYVSSTYGALLESKNITDTGYLPLTLSGNKILMLDGNVIINSTSDAGYKLDVNGTARATQITSASNYGSFNVNSVNVLDFGDGLRIGYSNSVTKITLFTTSGTPRFQVVNNGNVLIGTTTDVASSLVTMESTTKGFLPPRMTTTQKNAIASPAAGLIVYDTTTNKHCGYNGTTWNDLY